MQQSGESRRGRCAPAMASRVWLVVSLLVASAQAQDAFQVKGKTVAVNQMAQDVQGGGNAPSPATVVGADGRVHRIVRIEDLPWFEAQQIGDADTGQVKLPEIALADVKHLQYVPPNGTLISAPGNFDTEFWGPSFALQAKISAELPADFDHFLVSFHPDVDLNNARTFVFRANGLVEERPDLRPGELLVAGNRQVAEKIAALDEVAWIYPASSDIIQAAPVLGCPGATTTLGMVGEFVAKVGEGWDGSGLGSVTLQYGFQTLSAKLPPDQIKSEFARALAEWSSHVQVNFTEGGAVTALKRLNVLFGSGAHGDAYPFDGQGKVLAHTFYPNPPNPEPIAGDLHFDEDENWKVGADIDFYSVALHELGHALGLGHSDRPSAVMYAYYKRATTLTEEDISAIQSLYAARTTAPPPTPTPTAPTTPTSNTPTPPTPAPTPTPKPPTTPAPSPTPTPESPTSDSLPPSLTVVAPTTSATITTAASINVSGTATDNVRIARVTWQPKGGIETPADGTTQWTARDIPLIRGTNYLTLRAYDAAGNSSWRSVTITRR